MTIEELNAKIREKMTALRTYARDRAPEVIGVEAVNHFKEAFDREAFDGKKWSDVKRREPDSPWYGHSGQTGKFSPARATAKILDGETKELRDAIRSVPHPGRIVIKNEKPYAAVHNFGLQAKIYGKKLFTMPKRPFMGVTDELEKNILDKMKRDIHNILNS